MDVYSRIEDWIAGNMTDSERNEFEQEMQDNPELKEQATTYMTLHRYMLGEPSAEQGEAALRSTVNEARAEYKPGDSQAPKVVQMRGKLLLALTAVAAAIALFFVIRFTFFNTREEPSQLYASYATFDKLSAIRGDSADSTETGAIASFNAGDYGQAIPLLQDFTGRKPGETKYLLALAYALTRQDRFAEADSSLNNIIANGAPFFQDNATWLLALSKLKQQKKEECISLLKSIPAGSDFHSKAVELLGKID